MNFRSPFSAPCQAARRNRPALGIVQGVISRAFFACGLFAALAFFPAHNALFAATVPPALCEDGPIIVMSDEIESIGPNPADTYLDIVAREGIVLQVVELLRDGTPVLREEPNAGDISLNTSSVNAGTYTLRITTQNAVHTTTIVVAH